MKYFVLFVILLISGCSSINSLPQSASEISFDGAEGKTGWSEWQEELFIKDIDVRTAYMASKYGMSHAGFTIKRANFSDRMVLGEHGITAYDWNVVAGVYVMEQSDGCSIKVIVEGSKDIGFWGDMTAKSWPQEIFEGIRNYILTESSISDTNKGIFR
jgi:hypothetical protein